MWPPPKKLLLFVLLKNSSKYNTKTHFLKILPNKHLTTDKDSLTLEKAENLIIFFFYKSDVLYTKKKHKALLSTHERERKAPQAYIGNPNQQHNESANTPLSTQKVYQGTQNQTPKQPKSSKEPKQHPNSISPRAPQKTLVHLRRE
jgi:hypothetical protein